MLRLSYKYLYSHVYFALINILSMEIYFHYVEISGEGNMQSNIGISEAQLLRYIAFNANTGKKSIKSNEFLPYENLKQYTKVKIF